MPIEEGIGEGGLAPIEESANHEGEKAIQQQKNDDENIGDRRGKIGAELALGDGLDIPRQIHCCPFPATVSGMVMLRNTSSRRPSSVRNSSICQPLVASKTSRVKSVSPLARGKTVA